MTGIVNALRAAASKALGTSQPADVVEWRLGVCNTCVFRRRPMNPLERSSVLLSGAVVGDVCDVCACSISLLASATDAHQHVDSPEEAAKRPSFCWKHS